MKQVASSCLYKCYHFCFFQILKPSEKKAKYQYQGLNAARPVTPRGPTGVPGMKRKQNLSTTLWWNNQYWDMNIIKRALNAFLKPGSRDIETY